MKTPLDWIMFGQKAGVLRIPAQADVAGGLIPNSNGDVREEALMGTWDQRPWGEIIAVGV